MMKLNCALDRPGWRDALPVDAETVTGSATHFAGCRRELVAKGEVQGVSVGGVGAAASVVVSFDRFAGFTLDYVAAKHYRFHDVDKARRWALAAAKDGEWETSWVLVTEVIAADSATVLVSGESSSSVVLDAMAALPTDLTTVNLAEPKLGLSVSKWQGDGFAAVCHAATPMYHCARFRKKWLSGWRGELLGASSVDLNDVFIDDPFEEAEAGNDV